MSKDSLYRVAIQQSVLLRGEISLELNSKQQLLQTTFMISDVILYLCKLFHISVSTAFPPLYEPVLRVLVPK